MGNAANAKTMEEFQGAMIEFFQGEAETDRWRMCDLEDLLRSDSRYRQVVYLPQYLRCNSERFPAWFGSIDPRLLNTLRLGGNSTTWTDARGCIHSASGSDCMSQSSQPEFSILKLVIGAALASVAMTVCALHFRRSKDFNAGKGLDGPMSGPS